MASPFSGKTAWITGASSGIGEALAQALADAGANLVLSARREDELQRVRSSCARPDDHRVVPLDMADSGSLTAAAGQVLESGPVDLLINNAGMTQRSLVEETTLEVDRLIMEVNFFGAITLTKAVLPAMLARGSGHLVAVSSLAGKFGTPLRSAYAAAKHALIGWHDCLRAEVHDRGLRVTVICPGFVRTSASLNALSGDGSKHAKMDERLEQGLPPERAAAIILEGIAHERDEVLFGGKEVWLAHLKRLAPGRVNKLVRKLKVT